jgi:hypothetical protein
VLARLIGQGPIEVAKSGLLVFVTLIAAVALQQLAATRSGQTSDQADRSAVLSVARGFGQELTTYDYAHPDVQQRRLEPFVTRPVLDQVRLAFPDLAQSHAVSVGSTPDAYVQNLDADHAQVLLETRSIMQSQYTPPGTRGTGLLLCQLDHEPSGWRVSQYRWLTPVAEGVS